MRWVFAVIVAAHALIHLMGFAKAFGYAELPQLTQPISREFGLAWLAAAVLTLATVIAFLAWPRGWWMLGAGALIVSQAVIATSFSDAKAGTIANAILLVGVVYGALTWGPTSFRARYEEEAARGLARVRALPDPGVIGEADLAPLPVPVQHHLRATGLVGQPRTLSYRLRFRGRIRGAADEPWMDFTADQQSFADQPTRAFLMDATMRGLPVQSLHLFRDGHASFQVRVASVVSIVDAHGPDLDRAETVTLFNDMCLLAPATLLSPSVTWGAIDDRSVRAHFTHGGRTVSALLSFGEDGLLRDFVSDDRLRASRDGTSFTPQRFSTPVHDYRRVGALLLPWHADARWHPPEGELVYGEFELLEASFESQ